MTADPSSLQTDPESIEQTLLRAAAHQQAGEQHEAEALYRAILKIDPSHPKANHNLGVLLQQMQQFDAGLPYFLQALEAQPEQGQYWLSYIDALIKADQLANARDVLDIAKQQGLQGDTADALTAQLQESEQLVEQQQSQLASPNSAVARNKETKGKAKKQQIPSAAEIANLMALFNAGHLKEAEQLAQSMTGNYPRHEFGWMVLGAVLRQMGKHADALTALQKATAMSPNNPDAHNNLGITFKAMGRLDEAVASYKKALKLRPGIVEVHYNLANTLKDFGRLDEAEAAYRRAIDIKPGYAEAHNNLGNLLKDQERLKEAEVCYRRSLEILPNYAEALSNLGFLLQHFGETEEAEACCRRALQLKPDFADAHNNLGLTLKRMDRQQEAETSFRQALRIEPNFTQAHTNLGATLQELGKLDEAAASYQRALQIDPDNAEAHNNLGNIVLGRGQTAQAEEHFRRALEIKPDLAEARSNLGIALKDMGRLDEAETSCRHALEANPDFAEGYTNLGCVLKDLGRLEEAQTCFRRAMEIKPDYFRAHSNLLFSLNYDSGGAPADSLAEARQYGRLVAGKVSAPFAEWLCAREPVRLRIGFVSGDLRKHSVGYFMENLLAKFDQATVELIAYPTDSKSDELTARLKQYFSAWHPMCGLNDEAAAKLVHDDGVHVLVDLSGHTRDNRLPVFAWKPAPVQASWLGYLNTTGVDAVDYYLADPWTVPEKEEAYFTEKIYRLGESYLCFTPPEVDIQVAALPAIGNGYVTFGCFNNLTKMTDGVVAVWSRVLAAVPGSRLFLKTQQLQDASVRHATAARFAEQGIDARRLIMEGFVPQRTGHFAAYNRVDIALDPFPYPGITTSVEGLWMGVPLLTMAGEHFISRQGVGLMMNAGLPEWVANDADAYVARAVAHAGDLHSLSALRQRLRAQVLASPIFDAPRFARNFEQAMWKMWEQASRRM